MINTEVNSNVLGNCGASMPPAHKHSPLVKKIPLRDVQNDNRSLIGHHPETSPILEGRPISDAIKVSGTKRLTPDCSISPPLYRSMSKNGGNEHLVNAQRKFESELGKGRIHDNMDKSADCLQLSTNQSYRKQQELPRQQIQMRESNLNCAPVVRPNHMASIMSIHNSGPSVPTFLGKPVNGLPAAESNCLKVNSEISHSMYSKVTDEQREQRLHHLQKFLKQCDESNHRDYIQMLVNLAPAELSRHAVELEKRAIELTFEEGEEMRRMKDLKIKVKSDPMNNPSLATQYTQSRK